jgi:hypothetical protein
MKVGGTPPEKRKEAKGSGDQRGTWDLDTSQCAVSMYENGARASAQLQKKHP